MKKVLTVALLFTIGSVAHARLAVNLTCADVTFDGAANYADGDLFLYIVDANADGLTPPTADEFAPGADDTVIASGDALHLPGVAGLEGYTFSDQVFLDFATYKGGHVYLLVLDGISLGASEPGDGTLYVIYRDPDWALPNSDGGNLSGDYSMDFTNAVPGTIGGNGGNNPPVLDPIGPQAVNEGDLLTFTAQASDPNDDPPNNVTLSATNLPAGAEFVETRAGAVFTWTPTEAQGPGNYQVTISAVDDGDPPRSESEVVEITVNEVNEPPVLDPIGNREGKETELLAFTVTASDPNDIPPNTVTLNATNVPDGAQFTPATGVFEWTPAVGDAGIYQVTFKAADDGLPPLDDSEVVTITIAGLNNPPVIDPIEAQVVDEGSQLTFTVTADDRNDNPPNNVTLRAEGLPTGAEFVPETGVFTWTPTEAQGPGEYDVTIVAEDDGDPPESASTTVSITVNEVNESPVLDPIGDRDVDEETELTFTVTAGDPVDIPPNEVTLSVTDLPTGASFDAESGLFSWTPAANQQGDYEVIFTATDDGIPPLADSETVTITVNDSINNPPVAIPPMGLVVQAGQSVAIPLVATDPDGDEVTLSIVSPPGKGTLDTIDQDTQTVVYTANAGDSGDDHFTVKASDGRLESATVDAYVYVIGDGGWLVRLSTDTGDFPAIYFGADAGATDGYDPEYDTLYPGTRRQVVRAPRNLAALYRPDGSGTETTLYQRDVRQSNGDYFWVLKLEAYEGSLTVFWQPTALPLIALRMAECDVDGNLLVGDVGTPMTEFESVTVNQGEGAKYYRISVTAGEMVFGLELNDGWNLVSLPLAPTAPGVNDIFGDDGRTSGRALVRAIDGNVFDWDEMAQAYRAVEEMVAYEGYCLFVPSGTGSAAVRVYGTDPGSAPELEQGWNLRGVGNETAVSDRAILGSVWEWIVNEFRQASVLGPGSAYWFRSDGQ